MDLAKASWEPDCHLPELCLNEPSLPWPDLGPTLAYLSSSSPTLALASYYLSSTTYPTLALPWPNFTST